MAVPETATIAPTCTVDVELFDSLEEAIAFVAQHGGGVVHTEAANTDRVKGLELPKNVRLEPPRAAAA
jgi:H2-forming N5,N10-methylenetetrahydromethanopterin dehydrogenase-like enzyme